MSPIKPPAAAPVAAGQTPAPQPAKTTPGDNQAFRPGLLARSLGGEQPPRADAPQRTQSDASPQPPGGKQLFTLQALSAYAGVLVAEETNGAERTPAPGRARSAARSEGGPENRPRLPGTFLDIKA